MPKQNGYKAKNKKNHNSKFRNPKDTNTQDIPDNFRAEFTAEWRENAIENINKQSNDQVDK